MKRNLFIALMVAFSVTAYAQESMITLSGGWAFADLEETETSANGWRVNGLYEFNPMGSKIAHGLSVGYIGTSTSYSSDTLGGQSLNYELNINSWPIYYAPKVMFGEGSAKFFIKGALGMHFSGYKRTGSSAIVEANDAGFYGGAGAGFMKTFKETMFINIEYEWAYMSNAYYRDGFMNSVMIGLGKRF